MPKQKETLAGLIQVLDDGTTLEDILQGFGWWQKEKKRNIEKNKKRTVKKNQVEATGLKD